MFDFYSDKDFKNDDDKIIEFKQQFFETGLSEKTEYWKRKIFLFLKKFYDSIPIKIDYSCYNEKEIKIKIVDFLREDEGFSFQFSINRETASKSINAEGFEDIKIESPDWKKGKEYFIFECKCLKNNDTSLNEYLFNEYKKDGGLYRFLIGKYSYDVTFGGLLGFFQKGSCPNFIDKIKNRLINFSIKENNIEFGNLINSNLLNQKVTAFENSFQSDHKRFCNSKINNIHLYHLFYDFSH